MNAKIVVAVTATALCSLAWSPLVEADDAVITLDVTFSSPALNSPGTWELLGRIDDTGDGPDGSLGFSAIRALLTGIDFGIDGNAVNIASGIGAIFPGGGLPVLDLGGGVIDIIYGQDISSTGFIVPNVGNSGDQLIAFGTFSAGLSPGFGQDGDLFSSALFLTSTTPGGGPAIVAGQTVTEIIRTTVPEPTTSGLFFYCGVILLGCRRSK